jgi:gluconolactonase
LPADSAAKVFLTPTGNSNGLTFDKEGRLLMALQGGRKVVRLDSGNTLTVLAATYQGKKLNSPNDIVVKSDGSIFFTDPPYGIQPSQQELSFSGIYRMSPSGDLQVLDTTQAYPNGIAFSPDESLLYVSDTGTHKIYVWDVVADTAIARKRTLATMKGGADGMKVDSAGNIFSAGPGGIWVFSPAGAVLDTILVPETTTNCAWGDADRRTLYITAGGSVYRIRTVLTSAPVSPGVPEKGYRLGVNYPNPFNPVTTIEYALAATGFVELKVFDLLGREVATLVDGVQQGGDHRVRFDATGLASGVYLCRLRVPHAPEANGGTRDVGAAVKLSLMR